MCCSGKEFWFRTVVKCSFTITLVKYTGKCGCLIWCWFQRSFCTRCFVQSWLLNKVTFRTILVCKLSRFHLPVYRREKEQVGSLQRDRLVLCRSANAGKWAASGRTANRVLFVQAQLACSERNAFLKNLTLNFATRCLCKHYILSSVGQVLCAIWAAWRT